MNANSNLLFRLLLGIALALLVILSAQPMIPPRAVPANAPATSFSAERAMADLDVVAREPHGAGSEAQARVRAYIVEQVQTLGLEPIVETNRQVSNILVRLPGTDSTQTVLVTGHYDSQPPAPGAGDDGLSTVAMLEAIRVLHNTPALRNDILFLFSDGEELGWLGAYAYLNAHHEAKNETGVVLCFDGRPGNGPLILLETSPGDAWLVREMAGLPISLYGGSWNNRVERGEIDTDCSVFSAAGFTGIEIENEAAGTRYHTTRDTVDAISPDLLQGFGKTMLSLTGHFGSVDLRNHTTDVDLDFFIIPLAGLIAYPTWLMPILNMIGLLALVAMVVITYRSSRFSLSRFGMSLIGLLLGTIVVTLMAQLIWGWIENYYADELAAGYGFESSTAWITTLMVGAAILMIILLTVISRRLDPIHSIPAASVLYLLVWFAVYFMMDADNPATTAYVALPFLGSVMGLAVLTFTKKPVWKFMLLAISALVILMPLIPQLWLATYTREDAWIPVLATCVPLGLFIAQLDAIFGKARETMVNTRPSRLTSWWMSIPTWWKTSGFHKST